MIFPNWNVPQNVKAVSSTRIGGYSSGSYQSLNLGMHVGDSPELVQRNRQVFAERAGMPSDPVWLNQTHSTQIVQLNEPTRQVLDADGSFTSHSKVICTVMTADCLPVLLCNRQGTQVAAVHAGWRGLAGGILENAVKQFNGEVIAWLGPAIGPTAFEVGDDVVDAFCAVDSAAEMAFQPLKAVGKWLANMDMLAIQRLNHSGVADISSSGLCTYCDSEHFYSYRRDGITGRQASFIWLE